MEIKNNLFDTLKFVANSYTIREEFLNDKRHLVVPVVMMVEGVHSGSHGPILHQSEELAKWTEAWDGIPVTISHPEADGVNVSANSPTVLDKSSVGRIFNTTYDNGLKAEAWIDAEKINEISSDAYQAILKGKHMEVSVGVFNDTKSIEGEWAGETYDAIAYNYRPDHLALLPEEIGACSWEDGCGIRVNKEGVAMKDLLQTFKELSQKGYAVSLISNKQGYREILEALQSKINDLDNSNNYHYIEEVYDDHIIYRKVDVDGQGETLYKQNYDIDNEENIVFNGMGSEVRKQVEYVVMSQDTQLKVNFNNANKGGTMSTNGSLCCEAKVDELIANKQTHWQATDREWLLTQSEATLAKMSPMEPETKQEDPAEVQANKDAVIEEFKGSLKSVEDYTALMPEAMKVQVDGGVKLYNENREALVKGIITNTAEGIWEEETLKAMDDKTLENVSKSIKQPADYSGQGAGGGSAPTGEQPMIPVEYMRERKEDK